MVKISRANLQPRAMCRTSMSDRPSSKVGVMAMSANKWVKLLSVLCSSSSDEVKSQQATWHGKGRLEIENAVCVPVRAVLTSRSVGHRKNNGCGNSHCGLRDGGCELLFGDGTVEDTLDGGPSVPDGQWRVVGISQEVADVFLGMWARPTCGLKDERNEVD